MAHLLTERRRDELDLLLPDAYLGRTPLAGLGVGPTSSSPAAVKAELDQQLHHLDVAGVGPLTDQDYGLREFILTDPDHNEVRIGSPLH